MLAEWNVPFRALVDAAPDGLVVTDADGKLILVNNEAERMFGYAHGELAGQPLEVLIPEDRRGRHRHHVGSYTGAPRLRAMGSTMELYGRRKDGSEVPVEISLSPVQTERGLLIIAGVRDVTERRQLERDKERATGYLRSAVEAVQDAFLLFDANDRVVMVNSAARAVAGPAGDQSMVGRTFAELLDESVAAGAYVLADDETPESWKARRTAYHRDPQGTLELRTSDGRFVRVTERRTADGGTVTMISDITDDAKHAAELEVARKQAEAASEAKSEFLSSMSHELRTPLNAILGFAQLLERDRKQPLTERQLERLEHVTRGGEHLLRLIDDVLDLSRIEAGRITMSPEQVGVPEVLTEVVQTLEPMASRAGISIAVESLADPLPRVVADRTRLAQILMNFGSNAIKYGKPSGHVWVRAGLVADRVRISVRDDGVGIPEDKRDKIFEPFQRAGQEAGPIEGTGIGLTISKRLAEMMRASLGFNSVADGGSEFWIDLIAIDSSTTATSSVPVEAATGSALSSGPRRHTIVYIEDNPSNVAFMRELIDDLGTIELATAPTAEIGIELVRGRRPDVVIMDINLPGMSGFEATRRLAEWPETRDIPVIALSAAALAKDTARATSAGFYRYLTKPVKVAELMQTLEELLLDRPARA
ncbi:MAG: PAS domain S-box protein [Deltaproteobacteria bacterium]|nr:PAS domain S-box protein [Deltaproteobacteria bacterium]